MVVLKFGGTSVGSIERIRHVAQLIKNTQENEGPCCVVASAMSGETDRLVSLYKQISNDTHTLEYDLLVSSGEQASISLLCAALKALGLNSKPLLGYQAGFHTDQSRGRAKIQDIDPASVLALTNENIIPIVAGFQGADHQGNITTLGRGGSDTSAVALAAALKAKRCDIYTDVSGVYSADPRICPNAKRIKFMRFEEMMELASLGAKVLHPRSVEVAAKYKIPIRVLNTFEEGEGTLVGPQNNDFESPVVTALTTDNNLALITLKNIKDNVDVFYKLFDGLSKEGIIVDIIVHSAVRSDGSLDLSFSIQKDDIAEVESLLPTLGWPIDHIDSSLTKVSLVGSGMRSHTGVAARVCKTLAQNEIRVVCTTTSEIKISCVVASNQAETALKALHEEFQVDI